jgi:acyl-CoA thioester hydrolase
VTEPAPQPTAVYRFRVRYFETDQMRVAHHAHYFVWFEAARSEFCRKYRIDYARMEKDGLFMPVLEARCRYHLPIRYDDDLTVTATMVERTRRTLRMHYIVTRDGAELATGDTTQMLIDAEGRPRSFPGEIAARFDGTSD